MLLRQVCYLRSHKFLTTTNGGGFNMTDNKAWLQRDLLEQHSVDMRQFIDFRHATLPNGMRIIDTHNSSGVSYTILPDRGLDIWSATYNGIPLTWLSQGSPMPPDFGRKWLQQFNGGLLVTCGLTHAGHPENDIESGEYRDLHGHFSRLRATDITTNGVWHGDDYVLDLTGVIVEGELFGPQLRLTRTYRQTLGQPTIEVIDTIENRGDTTHPLMLLYHLNPGYPLIREGVQLHTPYEQVYPFNNIARAGLDRWPVYDAATPQYVEQVFLHHLKQDDTGMTEVVLASDDFGLSFAWPLRDMPYLTQWKNVRQGIYVCGVEPGNCVPEGLNKARDSGRVVMLEPGATASGRVLMTVLDGAEAVADAKARVDE
ncbi:MAG: DUF4432 family protein, partial [Chloroflexi bacterium]